MRLLPSIVAAVSVALLTACVTETVYPDGRIRKEDRAAEKSKLDPVAEPAYDARSLTARIKVELQPLGTVSYDAQVLPIVSPDGSFIAVQQGRAPTWPTLMAQPDAIVPLGTTLTIIDIGGTIPAKVDFPQPLPEGLILGRDADARGYLVEAPQADGSRWIGRVGWLTGRITWLVTDGYVNTHAMILPDGGLIYARRAIDESDFTLVVGDVALDMGVGSYSHPFPTGEPDLAYAFERTSQGTNVVAVRYGGLAPSVIARTLISTSRSPVAAYQAALPAFTVPSAVANAPLDLVFYLTRAERMAIFEPRYAALSPLPADSIASAALKGEKGVDGFFCTTPEGLVFTPRPEPSDPWEPEIGSPQPIAKILADPFVPRETTDPDRPYIMLGPDPARRDRLRLYALKPIT